MKWSLVVVLLGVVVLGLPHRAFASPPSVSAPTGPQSGGVFTGPFSFDTYVNCQSGVNFNGSYSSSLDGTNTFTFVGSPDGSLLVRINGGGSQLLTSCGDPFANPQTTVATYTVSKNTTPPPTPTPTPPPPTPTPTPPLGHTPTPTAPVGGGTTGSGGGPPASSTGGVTPTPEPGTSPTPTVSVAPGATTTPVVKHTTPAAPEQPVAAGANRWQQLLVILVAFAVVAASLFILYVRSKWLRHWLADIWLVAKIRTAPYWFRIKLMVRRGLRVVGRELPKRRGLSAHEHSGRVLAHHHTSYPALAFLVLVSTVLLGAYSATTHAASTTVSLTVLGPPPATPPTIDSPPDGQHTSVTTMTVQGSCLAGLVVEISRNATFAGSSFCNNGGSYSLLISLVDGQNDLVARQVDGLAQPSPDSANVTVYYDAPPPTPTPTPSPTPTPPAGVTTPRPPSSGGGTTVPTSPIIIISGQTAYQGAETHTPVLVSLRVTGGHPPYTITWDWGDGTVVRIESTDGLLSGSHTYISGGSYQMIVRAKDKYLHEAVMSLLAIVRGNEGIGALRGPDREGFLLIAWPVLGATALVMVSFWLGEWQRLSWWHALQARLPSS